MRERIHTLIRSGVAAAFLLSAGCSGRGDGRLTLTWAVGKDATGVQTELARLFSERSSSYTVRIIEMPESSTSQRDSYVTYLSAQDPSIDVYTIDITWPAEFAAAGWIAPLDALFTEQELGAFLRGPLEGCRYRGSLYAAPWFTDAGLLFYRRDLLERAGLRPPRTWDELARQAALLRDRHGINGFVFQGEQYEGLVCNFLEYLRAFGGDIMDGSGKVTLDTPQALEALAFWRDAVLGGKIAPQGVLTYKEEESRQVFTSGQAAFLRNWPYVWTVAQDTATSKVAGAVGIAPLPGKTPGTGVPTLGGWNLAVSQFSKHPEAAREFIRFMTGPEAQKRYALKGGRLPTLASVYRDPEVRAAAPHYRELYDAFTKARPRPVTPVYAQLSDILQIELHRTLTGQQSPQEALKRAQEQITDLFDRQLR